MKKKLAILVIDDEVSLEAIYTNFLTKLGADVTYCDHPQKGWRLIEKESYDLIITDLKMPVITGDEFISIVRESKLNNHTPIILCSGYINKLVITEMAREGKVYFLSKPFDSKGLLDLVGKILDVKKPEPAVSGSQVLSEKWLKDFTKKLQKVSEGEVTVENIKQFEAWNFDTISINFYVFKEEENIGVTLLLQLKTFLKMAGKIQGTQYKDIEDETLTVWQDLISSVSNKSGRLTFSKILRQEIINNPGQSSAFYQFNTNLGEILVFLN